MFTIRQPPKIIFGKNSILEFDFPENSLIITSKGAISRGWINCLGKKNFLIYSDVESNPSMETTEKIISQFKNKKFSTVIGMGGGSSLDVAKYVAFKLNKKKIMIPTTFGSGSEISRISVLKVDGKKQSFHDDGLISDIALIDYSLIQGTPENVLKNSAIDACAQCTEAYDSKIGNEFTRFVCEKAFDILEAAILNNDYEKLPYGSLLTGLGFGNSSTTLGHALSYVFSNEGYSHGHALAFTTSVSHQFNNSKFYHRFSKIVEKLHFEPIQLKQDIENAADTILTDKKHLDNNPKAVTKNDIIFLLTKINSGKTFDQF